MEQILLFDELAVIENNAKFYHWLTMELSNQKIQTGIDPLSMLIVNNSSRAYKLDLFLMAYSLLRWKDCMNLSLVDLLSGRPQIIEQAKTQRPITIKPLLNMQRERAELISRNVHPFFFSYDKIKYGIRNAAPFWLLNAMKRNNSATHIFRYLRASFLYVSNNDFNLASVLLGHSSTEAVKSYVPEDLISQYQSFIKKV